MRPKPILYHAHRPTSLPHVKRGRDHPAMAARRNGRLSEDEKIDVSPHVLRHTFLAQACRNQTCITAREAPVIRATALFGATSAGSADTR